MEDDDFISKSRRKRQMTELQVAGAALVKLSREQLERLDIPEALREAVLDVMERTLPPDHPSIHVARQNLALTLFQLGDLAGARSLQEKVLDARERTLPADHRDLQAAREILALTMLQLGDLNGALAAYRDSLTIFKALADRDKSNTQWQSDLSMSDSKIGDALKAQGKLDEAAKRFRDTIRRQPFHIEARLALASLHVDQNRFAAAERELAEIIQNVEKAIEQPEGEKLKPLAARCRNMLGHVLYRLGNHARAVEVLDMAMADAGDDVPRQAQILGDRALALSGLDEHEQAIHVRQNPIGRCEWRSSPPSSWRGYPHQALA